MVFAGQQTSLHAQTQFPANIYPDTSNFPFLHGVASFDPTSESVLLWTRTDPGLLQPPTISGTWELAEDSLFTNILQSDTFQTGFSSDYTVAVNVTGLQPATTYWYRFRVQDSLLSPTGRTRTAPDGPTDEVTFAVGSCSSVYSGFFNAYRSIGNRNDLDLVVHLGDYIYDFVDEDEEVRVPDPYPTNPQGLEGWRERHKYYLLDPDLRWARQRHPFTVIWDNHDVEADNDSLNPRPSVQAFQEYVPMRLPDTTQPEIIYRRLQYGNLVDLLMLDILLYRDAQSVPEPDRSMLGAQQRSWLEQELLNSQATWRVVGSQNLFAGWTLPNVVGLGGDALDDSNWDGYPAERRALMQYLADNAIGNNIVLSGDAHISFAMDLAIDPNDEALYNPTTGEGAVGVEFLPTSFSRGNLDEALGSDFLADIVAGASQLANPHHRYSEFISHGYGTLTITPDSAVARFHYLPILEQSVQEEIGQELVVLNGDNHWRRQGSVNRSERLITDNELRAYPNPTTGKLRLEGAALNNLQELPELDVLDMNGRKIARLPAQFSGNAIQTNLGGRSSGLYILRARFATGVFYQKIRVE